MSKLAHTKRADPQAAAGINGSAGHQAVEITAAPEGPVGQPGLTTEEARARLVQYGPNLLVPERKRPTIFAWLVPVISDPMVVLLLIASITYFLLGDHADAAVTLAALIPISLVSLILEKRAERALGQLQQLTAPRATVWRDDQRQEIPAEQLVPGDFVVLEEGDIVPADGRLVEGARLMLDESALTGESHPVLKDASADEAERQMLAGTTLLSGHGVAQVTATGTRTQYGQVGTLLANIEQPSTPLQQLIHRLVLQLAAVALVFCTGVVAVELIQGHGWGAAVIAGVSLAIAAIPEEFPMVFTLYLGLGAWRLARNRALIRRLTGVETLGATTVICSDKTGTLTLGRLDVAAVATRAGTTRVGESACPEARSLLDAAVLASEPRPFDPLEQAILRFGSSQGVDVATLHAGKLVEDYPFDPALKYMSHVWQHDGKIWIYAKGALEGILDVSHASAETRRWALETNSSLASQGMRVIAVAGGALTATVGDRLADESRLQFKGLVAFSDPVRPGVAEALRECREAGIRVIMITGDHPVTAHAVAGELGLVRADNHSVATGDDVDTADDAELGHLIRRANVFARIRPEQKYRLVRALRAQRQVVAMTGDGINDAPALREADIGVAMGQRGTAVARTAATMVLLDDNFATIVGAVRDGRRIFENLRRAFSYLLGFHVPLLLAALVIPLTGAPLLLLPVHLVWLELIVHPASSLVFEADPAASNLMRRPPRQTGVGLLAGVDWARPLALGIVLFLGVLVLYLVRLSQGALEAEARGLALTTLILGQTALVLEERSPAQPIWRTGWKGNWALPYVVGGTVGSLLIVQYLPALAGFLKLAPLSPESWGSAIAVALGATLWLEPVKAWRAAHVK